MTDFTAVVLAAGVGSRLRPLTDRMPKCLVPLGGETILGRMLRQLAEAGARRVVISAGYREADLRATLVGAPLPVEVVSNPDHAQTQNVVSLQRALARVRHGDVIKLDGDVVFEPAVLDRLRGAPGGALVAVDPRGPLGDEEMKVVAVGGTVLRFGKALDPARCAGESIGIERFDHEARRLLGAALDRAVARGRSDLYYEDVYNDLLGEGLVMGCVPVGDLAWTEVDDEADLARARALVRAETTRAR